MKFKSLLWRASLWFFLALCVLLLGWLWFSGSAETHAAFADGRRLIIDRETGAIQGKIHSSAPADILPIETPAEPAVPQPPVEETPSETSPAESAPEEQSSADAPEPGQQAPVEPSLPSFEETPAQKPAAEEVIVPGEELSTAPVQEDASLQDDEVTIVPSANPLPAASSRLIEKASEGDLPAIAPDGTKPWQYYAKPFEREAGQPVIAIIVTGLGHSKLATEKAMVLPENISLSFSPYARNVANWANTARLTGHEKLVDLPMEPSDYPASDPGPYGLILDKGLQENENRLHWLMARFTGYVGFVMPPNEVYTRHDEALTVLLQSLANRGLMVVMGHEPVGTGTVEIFESSTTPNIVADMLVDEELMANAIDTRLAALEQQAKKRGYAVGIVRATPLSIERLRVWSETLEEKGVRLAPVSAIVKLRFS